MSLVKMEYWEKLVDYYYDNIHWKEEPTPSISQWLERDFGANANYHSKFIHFKDPAKEQWFKLRWM